MVVSIRLCRPSRTGGGMPRRNEPRLGAVPPPVTMPTCRGLAPRPDHVIDEDGRRFSWWCPGQGGGGELSSLRPGLTPVRCDCQTGRASAARSAARLRRCSSRRSRSTRSTTHPPILKQYAQAHSVDHAGFTFLTGSFEEIDAVTRSYAVFRKAREGGSIDHTLPHFPGRPKRHAAGAVPRHALRPGGVPRGHPVSGEGERQS